MSDFEHTTSSHNKSSPNLEGAAYQTTRYVGGTGMGTGTFTLAARDIAWYSQTICTAVIIMGYVQFTFRTVHTMAR